MYQLALTCAYAARNAKARTIKRSYKEGNRLPPPGPSESLHTEVKKKGQCFRQYEQFGKLARCLEITNRSGEQWAKEGYVQIAVQIGAMIECVRLELGACGLAERIACCGHRPGWLGGKGEAGWQAPPQKESAKQI